MFKNWKKNKSATIGHLVSILEAVILGAIAGGILHILFPNKILLSVVTILAVALVWYIFEARE